MYYYINNISVVNSQLLHNYYKFRNLDFCINKKKFSVVFNFQSYWNFPCVFTSGFCFITKHVKLTEDLFFIEKEEARFYDEKQIAR